MKKVMVIALAVSAGVLGACCTPCVSPTTNEVPMYPVTVGEKTSLYEVVAPNALRLAPGVGFKEVPGPGGKNNGIILMRPNGATGGYMACGCIGATTSSCVTTSDNPDHPSCSGGCSDSEGNPQPCQLFGPIIGPPRDPLMIRFLAGPLPQ
ncbi:lipoprotein, putative [Citrifermentans bemidjiense Bem]|uniref:Lipoprotein, putative n=1 Tax=Citrifermentans bemidjiense (strain ATCC BAA-1014 / DSM 16622 / JCM 12645 / Bem) TaxID=404380 RepID=B5ECB3_CITBB|nr:lipoprotein, putative [Citrifermentans bemidjiense Bem]